MIRRIAVRKISLMVASKDENLKNLSQGVMRPSSTEIFTLSAKTNVCFLRMNIVLFECFYITLIIFVNRFILQAKVTIVLTLVAKLVAHLLNL